MEGLRGVYTHMDPELHRRLKEKLERDGKTFREWLERQARAYLNKKESIHEKRWK